MRLLKSPKLVRVRVRNEAETWITPLLTFVLMCFSCETTSAMALGSVQDKPRVIFFQADWCHWCKVLKPSVLAAKKRYEDKVEFIEINASDPANATVLSHYGVESIPTLVFVNTRADEQLSTVGPVPPEEIRRNIKYVLDSSQAH